MPLTLRAVIAYGVGVSFCRWLNAVKAAAPFVRTAISRNRSDPGKAVAPKSRMAVNTPALTGTEEVLTVPPICAPPVGAVHKLKFRSYEPVAALGPSARRP